MSFIPWPLSVPVLTDGMVTLRAHHTRDIEPMVEMVTDPQTQSWTSVPPEYHQKAAELFLTDVVTPGWESGTNRIWVVEVDGVFVGQVDLKGEGPIKEIAYVTHPGFRNRGVTRAAVRLVLNYAFTDLNTDVVRWCARVGNVPSLKVAYSCGFTMHETIPRMLHEHGQAHDAWTGSIAFGEPSYPTREWAASRIAGDRVALRPLTERDFERWDEALNAGAAQTYLVSTTGAYATGSAASRFGAIAWDSARRRSCVWAITDGVTDDFSGLVIAHGLNDSFGGGTELEWLLHPSAQGRGLMRESVQLVLDQLLSPEGFNQRRVSAFVAESNLASNRVAQSVGGRLFGTQTASEPIGDGVFDNLNEYEWVR
ncbi:MAG: N-acetyltransferase [Aeromicrobium sp.]|jgi:ribosomal-protein-alanine N-acetyltransferase|nr:MAG: N-acetyltransferase [Aeromicrobium sp.]